MGFNINNFPFLEKDIEAISIYELIAKIGNKVVEIEKSNTDIENLVNELNEAFTELKNYVDEYLVDVDEIKAQIEVIQEQILGLNNKVESYNTNLINLINNNFNILKAYIDDQIGVVNSRIDNLEIGAISVYNPTTGILQPLQDVINDLYGITNKDGLTATEFDGLDLTATAFDAYQITAYEFDSQGKVILV